MIKFKKGQKVTITKACRNWYSEHMLGTYRFTARNWKNESIVVLDPNDLPELVFWSTATKGTKVTGKVLASVTISSVKDPDAAVRVALTNKYGSYTGYMIPEHIRKV